MRHDAFGAFSPIAIIVMSFGAARAELPTMQAQQRCTAVYLAVAELTSDKTLQQRAKVFFSHAFDQVVAHIGKEPAKEQITKAVRQIGEDLKGQQTIDPLLLEMKKCESIVAPP